MNTQTVPDFTGLPDVNLADIPQEALESGMIDAMKRHGDAMYLIGLGAALKLLDLTFLHSKEGDAVWARGKLQDLIRKGAP